MFPPESIRKQSDADSMKKEDVKKEVTVSIST